MSDEEIFWSANTKTSDATVSSEEETQKQFQDLKAERTRIRCKVTKITNEVKAEYEKKNDADVDELAFLAKKLEDECSILNKINSELLPYGVSDEGPQLPEAEHILFKATRLVSRLERIQESSNGSLPPQNHNDDSHRYCGAPKVRPLPPPKFDGNPLNWRPFWDQFCAAVDNQPVDNITKFMHLKSALPDEGKAASDFFFWCC